MEKLRVRSKKEAVRARDEEARLNLLFQRLNSGKSAEEVYTDIERERIQRESGSRFDGARRRTPADRIPQQPVPEDQMRYFYEPSLRQVLAFRAPVTGIIDSDNFRRKRLLELLSSEDSSWKPADKDMLHTLRKDERFTQANSRNVLEGLLKNNRKTFDVE